MGCWGWCVEVARSKGKLGRGRRGPPPFLHADLRWRVKPAECAQLQKTRRDTDTSTRLLECARTGVKQNLSNVADSGEEHSIIWGMFTAATMNAATFMGKNFLDNQNSILNSTDLTLKKMFDISDKLVSAGCLGGKCKFSCIVSSVRVARRWLTTFHREVTAFGGTYPGSWLSGAWQDLVTIDVRARVVSPCWVGAWSLRPELALADEDVLRASEKYLTREAAEGPVAEQQSVGRASAQIEWSRKIGSLQ